MSERGRKVGLVLPSWEDYSGSGQSPDTASILATAAHIEACGFDSVWLVDHLVSEPAVDEADFGYELPDFYRGLKIGYWECWTLAAALAATTERVEIGTMVSNTGYRHPGLLAQMVNTIDDLSSGRITVGLGAGDYPGEHATFGFPFERRVGRFEEALQILRPLLRGEQVSFEGEFYRTHRAEVRPASKRPGGPPLMIGLLKGGPRMKRLVAQYADVWNCWIAEDTRLDLYRDSLRDITSACEKHGRDPATLAKNVGIGFVFPGGNPELIGGNPITGSIAEITDQLAALLEEDADHYAVMLEPWTHDSIQHFAEIVQALRRDGG